MKKILLYLAAICLAVSVNASVASEIEDYSSTIDIFKKSPQVEKFFDSAYGYAVFPMVGKAAWLVGFTYGKGQVYRGGYVTGTTSVYHGSLGFQGGGQVYSQIIFFQDQRAYDEFALGALEVDARAAVVVVTAGAQAQAGSTGVTGATSTGPGSSTQVGARYAKGLAVFVQSKGGLMLDVSGGVQKFTFTPIASSSSITAAGL